MPIFDNKVKHDLKYIEEISEEFARYVGQIILNVFYGVAKNIGVDDPDKLATKPPTRLQKGFLSGLKGIGKRIKGYLGRRKQSPYKPFTISGMKLYKKGKPLTNAEWHKFENDIIKYTEPYLQSASEEVAVKGILLAMASAEMDAQGKSPIQYGKKSYEQVEREKFGGYIPDNMLSASERFKLDEEQKKSMMLAHSRVAEYVQTAREDVRKAIKEQVITAHRQGKDYRELASDLYWMAEDKPELKKYTTEKILRDWHRVAKTELAYIHEIGKLGATESHAKESLKRPDRAIYYVFGGSGKCEWCGKYQGVVVRQIPIEMAGDTDRLDQLGIKDPYAEIAIWQGKNNIGRSQKDWWLCTPVHPWCSDTFSRIYPDVQEYDKQTGRIKLKEKDKKDSKFPSFEIPADFLKEIEDLNAKNKARQEKMQADRMKNIHKKDKEYYEQDIIVNKKEIAGYDNQGRRIVESKGQKYVEVSPSEFNARLDEWRENPALPIPVSTAQKDHNLIFGNLK